MESRQTGVMAPQRYQALLEIAAREFAAAGYERASLNLIIRACGMSKSSFYHYFSSKAELFDTVVREAAGAMGADIAVPDPATLAGPGYWDRIATLAQRLLDVSMREAWYGDLGKLFYLPDAPVDDSPALRKVLEAVTGWVRGALEAGRASGAVRDDLPPALQAELALAVLQALDRWSVQHLDEIGPGDREKMTTTQIDLIRRLLAP